MKRILERLRLTPRNYRIGAFDLVLAPDHALPRYQREFVTYDRFLPFLASELAPGSTVIDIGANIGDTIAAMASVNSQLTYFAVEPAPEFLELLSRNVAAMRSVNPELQVSIVPAFVSNGLQVSSLAGRNGSRHAILGTQETRELPELQRISLDALVEVHGIENLRLIKCDTDGFDWSVLDSGKNAIASSGALVFFECDVGATREWGENYFASCRTLVAAGYSEFHVFDNFGAYMCRIRDLESLRGLFDYIRLQNLGAVHRTIYYIDILALRSRDAAVADAAISAFNAKHANF